MPKRTKAEPATIDAEIVEAKPEASTAPTPAPSTSLIVTKSAPAPFSALAPVMNLSVATHRMQEFQSFIAGYLVKDEDFGTIPGTKKPSLYKPGADKLCEVYGIADTYPADRIRRVEDWNKEPPLFDYEITCVLIDRRTETVISEGMGSCNSWEDNYRWRDCKKVCPQCKQETIIKGKDEYGGGWLCYAKKGGCGAKFPDGDPAIEKQEVGRVINESVPTLKNTILKMAKKRAKIDAVLSATRSSGVFNQDLEDIRAASMSDEGHGHVEPANTAKAADAAKAAPAGPKTKKFSGKVGNVKSVAADGYGLVLILRIAWKSKRRDNGKEYTASAIVVAEQPNFVRLLEGSVGTHLEVMCSEQPGATGKVYWRIDQILKGGTAPAPRPAVAKQDANPQQSDDLFASQAASAKPTPQPSQTKAELATPSPAAARGPAPVIKKVVRTLVVGKKEVDVEMLQVRGKILCFGMDRNGLVTEPKVFKSDSSAYMVVVIEGLPDFMQPNNQKSQHDKFWLWHKSLHEALKTAKVGDTIVFCYEVEKSKEGFVFQQIELIDWIGGVEFKEGKPVTATPPAEAAKGDMTY
jgi:hypothetical protein